MRSYRSFFMTIFFVLVFSGSVMAQSLWEDGNSLVEDHKPSDVGDIVTVSVEEKTRAKDEANTDISKENASSASDGTGILDFVSKLGFSTESSMEGDGSTERTHNLSTTVTCLVTEIVSGGNLRLEGRKDIQVQGETMTLEITGIVRPVDIDPDNVVRSDRLANVSVSVEGIGTISDIQTPGILTKLFNAIF